MLQTINDVRNTF